MPHTAEPRLSPANTLHSRQSLQYVAAEQRFVNSAKKSVRSQQYIHPAFDLDLTDVLGTIPASSTGTGEKPERLDVLVNADQARRDALTPAMIEADFARSDAMLAVRPAFRLASAILTHPEQLPYWHGIWRAGQDVLSNSGLCHRGTFSAQQSLDPIAVADTLEFLEQLGQGIFLTFEDMGATLYGQCINPPALVLPNSQLMRNWMTAPRLPYDKRPQRFARIRLSIPHFMEPCLRWRAMTVPQLHALWFRLAKTMLHELTHAAMRFAFRHTFNGRGRIGEPFFEEEPAAEVG